MKRMMKIGFLALVALVILSPLALTNLARATEGDTGDNVGSIKLSPSDVGLPQHGVDASLSNILSTVFFWGAALAVIMIVIGGIIYITSGSDETNLRRAKATIYYAVIGFVVLLLAFAITKLVTELV